MLDAGFLNLFKFYFMVYSSICCSYYYNV